MNWIWVENIKVEVKNQTTFNFPVIWKKVEALFKGGGSSLWSVPLLFPSYGKLTVGCEDNYKHQTNKTKNINLQFLKKNPTVCSKVRVRMRGFHHEFKLLMDKKLV